jgi:DNA-binding Lrp family transcriptional regulator
VYRVSGLYDVVAMVGTDAMTDLKMIITEKIRKLDDIRSVVTMMVARESAGLAA